MPHSLGLDAVARQNIGLLTTQARSIIAASLPQFGHSRVEFLDEGYDFWVFEVDGVWVFRFPKRERSVSKLRRESDLLAELTDWVTLPIPRYEFFGGKARGRPRFVGYRKLPGRPAHRTESVDRRSVARQLGIFLGELHAYPIERARESGLTPIDDCIAVRRERALSELDGITVDLGIDLAEVGRYLETDAPRSYQGRPTLVHNDLWAEHVLLDSRSGRVCGVIDWGDAVLGDPALDFSFLYAWYGERWLSAILECYPLSADPGLVLRSKYLAACSAIHAAALCREQRRIVWIEAARRALQWVMRS